MMTPIEHQNRCFFFDLDGTLCDSRPGLRYSFSAAFERLGFGKRDSVEIDRFLGTPLPEAFRSVLESLSDAEVNAGIAAFRRAYEDKGIRQSPLYQGADEMLKRIRDMGGRSWIVTSKPTIYAKAVAENVGITPYLNGVIGAGSDEKDTKTTLVARALAESGAAPKDCLMLGDRYYDVVGALENGVQPVGALWGYGASQELRDAGCRAFASSIADFREHYVDGQLSLFWDDAPRPPSRDTKPRRRDDRQPSRPTAPTKL